MLYELERDGRTVYCSSYAVVAALVGMGWTLNESGHWAILVDGLVAGSPDHGDGV